MAMVPFCPDMGRFYPRAPPSTAPGCCVREWFAPALSRLHEKFYLSGFIVVVVIKSVEFVILYDIILHVF